MKARAASEASNFQPVEILRDIGDPVRKTSGAESEALGLSVKLKSQAFDPKPPASMQPVSRTAWRDPQIRSLTGPAARLHGAREPTAGAVRASTPGLAFFLHPKTKGYSKANPAVRLPIHFQDTHVSTSNFHALSSQGFSNSCLTAHKPQIA